MKLINETVLLNKLVNRFSLEDYIKQPFLLAETIVPVTNIDKVALATKNIKTTSTATTATHIHFPPKGHRWIIEAVRLERANTGVMYINIRGDGSVDHRVAYTSGLELSQPNLHLTIDYPHGLNLEFGAGTSGVLISVFHYTEQKM